MDFINKLPFNNKILLLCIFAQATLVPMFFGVDVPFRDEWDSIILSLVNATESGFKLSQLLTNVNEHRLPLPLSLFHAFSQPRFHPKAFMIISGVTQLFGFFAIVKSLNWDSPKKITENQSKINLLWVTLAILFFHWGQLINMLMGLQIFWVLGSVGTLFFILGLMEGSYLKTVFGHLVASFSFPAYPLHLVLLSVFILSTFLKTKRFPHNYKFWTIVILTLIASGIFFFSTYFSNTNNSVTISLGRMLKFFLFMLASPFSRYKEGLAWIFGPTFLCLLTYITITRPRITSQIPFFLLTSMTLATSAMIAYGRHSLDSAYAFSGHYLAFTLPGWCVIIYELLGRSIDKSFFTKANYALIVIIGGLSIRGLYKELRDRRPILVKAESCIKNNIEQTNDCKTAMEFLFLNGFEQKYNRTKIARKKGIYP